MIVEQPLQHLRHGERIGQPDQRFNLAKLAHLHSAAELAIAVCAMDRRRYLLHKYVACVRADDGHSGVNACRVVVQRAVPDRNAVHVGDAVARPGRVVAGNAHPVANPFSLLHFVPTFAFRRFLNQRR
ncbi:hypothetical protein SDC9_139355 [bioreactor metagenome]|uniref:Uncharacterized protein n=1 Tax=bioreactor metagenome TaxID=1076179 RepID=A0A645DRW7_9ZZZZ